MLNPFTQPDAHVHIIGIGGAGMSAIARVLLGTGVKVSGCDRQLNDMTRALQQDGATIFEGHDAAHLAGATVLLVSSAVKNDHPEVLAAKAANIPILDRRDAFPYLLPDKIQIAVAGTHGKTTTTALIVHLLREAGQDPSYIVGGVMTNTGDNAHVGKGAAFVIEADEYGGMFLGLSPRIAVLTNVEHDHPDIFPTIGDVMSMFRQFLARIADDGTLIACADDPLAMKLAHERKAAGKAVITYGLDNPAADWSALTNERDEIDIMAATDFTIRCFHGDKPIRKRAIIRLAGQHNIRNTLAAVAAVHIYGVPLESIIPALSTFQGTARRFELLGEANGVKVISDYAHHPTAIRAMLEATRQRYGKAKIWAVWQPHTYSRTRLLANSFAHAFSHADHVLIMDIYAAREQPQPGDLTASDLAKMATKAGHRDARFTAGLENTAAVLINEVRPGDVVIIFSAGDAPKVGELLLQKRGQ